MDDSRDAVQREAGPGIGLARGFLAHSQIHKRQSRAIRIDVKQLDRADIDAREFHPIADREPRLPRASSSCSIWQKDRPACTLRALRCVRRTRRSCVEARNACFRWRGCWRGRRWRDRRRNPQVQELDRHVHGPCFRRNLNRVKPELLRSDLLQHQWQVAAAWPPAPSFGADAQGSTSGLVGFGFSRREQ